MPPIIIITSLPPTPCAPNSRLTPRPPPMALVARKGLPLPTLTNYDLPERQPGAQ